MMIYEILFRFSCSESKKVYDTPADGEAKDIRGKNTNDSWQEGRCHKACCSQTGVKDYDPAKVLDIKTASKEIGKIPQTSHPAVEETKGKGSRKEEHRVLEIGSGSQDNDVSQKGDGIGVKFTKWFHLV